MVASGLFSGVLFKMQGETIYSGRENEGQLIMLMGECSILDIKPQDHFYAPGSIFGDHLLNVPQSSKIIPLPISYRRAFIYSNFFGYHRA